MHKKKSCVFDENFMRIVNMHIFDKKNFFTL